MRFSSTCAGDGIMCGRSLVWSQISSMFQKWALISKVILHKSGDESKAVGAIAVVSFHTQGGGVPGTLPQQNVWSSAYAKMNRGISSRNPSASCRQPQLQTATEEQLQKNCSYVERIIIVVTGKRWWNDEAKVKMSDESVNPITC